MISKLRKLPPATRRMYVFFGLLTLWTGAGPVMAALSLRQGLNEGWPPETQGEWAGFGLGVGGFMVLLTGTLVSVGQHSRVVKQESLMKRTQQEAQG